MAKSDTTWAEEEEGEAEDDDEEHSSQRMSALLCAAECHCTQSDWPELEEAKKKRCKAQTEGASPSLRTSRPSHGTEQGAQGTSNLPGMRPTLDRKHATTDWRTRETSKCSRPPLFQRIAPHRPHQRPPPAVYAQPQHVPLKPSRSGRSITSPTNKPVAFQSGSTVRERACFLPLSTVEPFNPRGSLQTDPSHRTRNASGPRWRRRLYFAALSNETTSSHRLRMLSISTHFVMLFIRP